MWIAEVSVNGQAMDMTSWRLQDRALAWPPFLKNAHRLHVRVETVQSVPNLPPRLTTMLLCLLNYAMYDLHSFLHRVKTIGSVDIDYVASGNPVSDQLLEKTLYPLTLLHVKTVLRGISDEVHAWFTQTAQHAHEGTDANLQALKTARRILHVDLPMPHGLDARHQLTEAKELARKAFDWSHHNNFENAMVSAKTLRSFTNAIDIMRQPQR